MSLASTQHPYSSSSLDIPAITTPKSANDTEAALGTLLGAFANATSSTSMERAAPEYPQSGLHKPSQPAFRDTQSEEQSADHASAAQYTPQQEVRPSNYSTSATPTSEYGVGYPTSARSATFPEQVHQRQQYHPASNHSGSSGGMAQSTSPSSMPLQDGQSSHPNIKSDSDVPIDPSIAASSPTYPPHGQYSPYPPQQEMQHGYPQHPGGPMYQPRPDWAGYGAPQHGMHQYPTTGASTPTTGAPVRPGQVS